MPRITTCLWFGDNAEDAVNFCVSIFKETLINSGFTQHKDVLPFSMSNNSLKMAAKENRIFLLRPLKIPGWNYSEVL